MTKLPPPKQQPARRGRPVGSTAPIAKLPKYDSIEAMSNDTGIPIALLRWSKKQGCPAFRNTRVDCKEWLQWYFAQDLDESEQKIWSNELKRVQTAREEIKLEQDRKRVIDFAQVDRFIGILVAQIFFGELEKIEATFPSSLKGKSEIEISETCKAAVDRIRKQLRSKLEDLKARKI